MWRKILPFVVALVVFILTLQVTVFDLPQRIALGILGIAVILWVTEVIPLYVTSFIILLLTTTVLARTLQMEFKPFLHAFFSPILLLFLGGFVLARAMHVYEVEELIANTILRHVGKRPYPVLLGFMVTTAFLSMWMSNTASTALMLAVALPVIKHAKEFSKSIVLGIPFAASIGGMCTPIGTPPNAIAIAALREAGYPMPFIEWMARNLPIGLLGIFVASVVLYMFYRPTITEIPVTIKRISIERNGKFTLAVLILTIVLWLTTRLHGVSSHIVALIPVVLFFGTGLLKRDDFRNLEWDILMLMGGGLALGEAIRVTGLGTRIVELLGIGNFSPFMVLIMFLVITTVLSNFMSNTSATAVIIPLAMACTGLLPTLPIAIALAASTAMSLPISTPPNAIAYGSGYIKIKDMAVAGTLIGVFILIIIGISAMSWWRLF